MFEVNYVAYCDVDGDGNIIAGTWGGNIIPDRQYDCFFYLGKEFDPNFELLDYKVEMNGYKAILVKAK